MRKSALGGVPARIAVAALVAAVVTPLATAGSAGAASTTGAAKLAHAKRVAAKNLKDAKIDGSLNPAISVKGASSEKLDRSAFASRGPVAAMIELTPAPAADAYAKALRLGRTAAVAAGRSQSSTVESTAASVASHFGASATRATALYRVHALYSGIAVTTDASKLVALSRLPGVKAIHPITPKSVSNATTVPLIGAPNVWTGRSDTGQGVKIGIIDTGIDYTHANFGGAGTTGAYDAAKAADAGPFTPTAKVVGGYDFVGDAYDPSSSNPAINTPAPDPNPLDCEGHGSHVAGTAAGEGVTAAGDTYTGPYTTGLDPADFKIGPGVAPQADLYALKVFGCEGSTNVVAAALDWAADPNGDGNLSDHLDVVNMSLGSDFGSPQDPDSVASDNASKVGIIVVAAAGNGGDLYDVGGSPGNARTVIGVAASNDDTLVDGFSVSPTTVEPANTVDGTRDGVMPAEESAAYDWINDPGATGAVTTIGTWGQPDATNSDGCDPISQDLTGKIVLLEWTEKDSARRCGSAGRSGKAFAAGAAGVLLGSDQNDFSAGITGDSRLPVMLTVKQSSDAIRAALGGGVVTATLDNSQHAKERILNPSPKAAVARFSSRGIGMAGNVKPDVAAPGVAVLSTAVGTGTEGVGESGTSMATPHVAGVAALVRKAHPTWSVEQVKAAIMNTATDDLFAHPDQTGGMAAPMRVGAGRVKADAAVATQTLAWDISDPGAVSVSFGPVAAATTTTLTKTIRVMSTRPVSGAAYTLAYQAITSIPGVTYTVSPNQLSLAPNTPVDVKVTLTVNPLLLTRTNDPTYDRNSGIGLENNFYADASGRVVLTPAGATTGGALRVPVYSAPRRASTMTQASSAVVSASGTVRTGSLALTGTGFDQGSGDAEQASTVSAFELQASSPRKPDCSAVLILGCTAYPDDRAGDLKYVGVASDAPIYRSFGFNPFSADPAGDGSLAPALAYFAVSAHGPWRTAASAHEYDVRIDADGNGTDDLVVFNTRLTGTDVFVAVTADWNTGEVQDVELLNGSDGSFDTDPFNSDTMVLPVALNALAPYGLTGAAGHTRAKYHVQAITFNGLTDAVGEPTRLSADLNSPGLGASGDFLSAVLNTDLPGASHNLALREDTSTYTADKPLGLLVVHHFNGDGARAQVVTVRRATTTRIVSSKPTATFGTQPLVTVTVSPSVATGSVQVKEGSKVWLTGKLVGGKVTLKLPKLARGKHTLVAVYLGDTQYAPSTSPAIVQTIT